VRIDQLGDAFPRRQAAFLVLRFDGFRAAALLNLKLPSSWFLISATRSTNRRVFFS